MTFLINPFVFAAAGPGPTAYQHWRLYVTANDGGSYVSFSEIELLDGATVLTDPSNPNDLSPSQSGDGAVGSAVDGVDNYAGSECGSSWSGGPYWWQIDLGAAHPVSSMTLRSQRVVTGRTPTTFVLQSSASGSGPWTDVITVTGSTGWGIQEQRTFTP